MKTRKIVVEIICVVLMMFWFYEGIYKVAYFQQFGFYITHAPLLRSAGGMLKYLIPFGEIGLAVMFMLPKYRTVALYSTIAALLLFVFWIMSVYLFTGWLFWPYHALWENPTWIQKMLISLGICWLSFVVIMLSIPVRTVKKLVLNNNNSKFSL